jgi:hypothetical protein
MTPEQAYLAFRAACGDASAKVTIWDQVVMDCAELGLPPSRTEIRKEIANGFLDGSKYRPNSEKPFRKHEGPPPAPTVRTYDFDTPERGYFQIMLDANTWILKTLRKSDATGKATFGDSSPLAAQLKALKSKLEKK